MGLGHASSKKSAGPFRYFNSSARLDGPTNRAGPTIQRSIESACPVWSKASQQRRTPGLAGMADQKQTPLPVSACRSARGGLHLAGTLKT